MKKVKEIIIMGGSFEGYGNVTLSAEYNAWVDPDALDIVVKAGLPLVFVPLDVTEKVWLDMDVVIPYRHNSILAKFVIDITEPVSVFMITSLLLMLFDNWLQIESTWKTGERNAHA